MGEGSGDPATGAIVLTPFFESVTYTNSNDAIRFVRNPGKKASGLTDIGAVSTGGYIVNNTSSSDDAALNNTTAITYENTMDKASFGGFVVFVHTISPIFSPDTFSDKRRIF